MFEYRADLLDALDSDTLRCLVDLGFHARHEVDLRLADVRAPETGEPGAAECLGFVSRWVTELAAVKWPLLIRTQTTQQLEPSERRSFTRYVADIHDLHQPRHLNGELRAYLALHPEWGPGRTFGKDPR